MEAVSRVRAKVDLRPGPKHIPSREQRLSVYVDRNNDTVLLAVE